MSISGRRPSRPITGPTKLRTVSKIRRDRETAYTNDWDAISYEVKRRAGFRCQKCGSTKGPLEADHIIPVAKGGPTVFFNLACHCWRCHSKRPGHGHLFKDRILKRAKVKKPRKL
jgi:5-methylcytosine-specific restriction endonuclease McrA